MMERHQAPCVRLNRVLNRYHGSMAMILRIPEELALVQHTSKSALLLQGAELVLHRHGRSRDIEEGLEFVSSHDAELLKRLEDA
jgi:hypothetical protein